MSSIGQPYGIFCLQGTEAQALLKKQGKPSQNRLWGRRGLCDMLYTLLAVIRAVLAEFVEYLLHRLCTA